MDCTVVLVLQKAVEHPNGKNPSTYCLPNISTHYNINFNVYEKGKLPCPNNNATFHSTFGSSSEELCVCMTTMLCDGFWPKTDFGKNDIMRLKGNRMAQVSPSWHLPLLSKRTTKNGPQLQSNP